MMSRNDSVALSPLLQQHQFIFDLIKNTTADYAFLMDIREDIIIVSPGFVKDFDVPADCMTGIKDILLPLAQRQDRAVISGFFDTLSSDSSDLRQVEFRLINRKGDYIWLMLKGKISMDDDGRPQLLAGVISQLARRNLADTVTGLLNRYQFTEDLRKTLLECATTGEGGGIIIFGLDNFKTVNEAFNHSVGDIILRQISERMLENIPRGLSLYRLDGDEFGVIFPGADEEELESLYIRIQREFSRPQHYDGRQYLVTVSAGVVFYPQAANDALALHKYAQAALDTAKTGGKNRISYFSEEVYNRWLSSLTIQEQILQDVKAGCRNFELYFQPQVAGEDKRIIGAETLLRWKNERGLMVSPGEFIAILENTKTIIPVGRWVIEQAVRICKKWRQVEPTFKISVNMSHEQLKDLSFIEFVKDCLHRHQLPPDAIVLELTESKIVSDMQFVNKQFARFRDSGIKIAMDDFGTGYSSLSSLKQLSCDIVKIDRAFVMKILENNFDQKLVEYTVDLCHSIGLTTCIEGVENQAEYDVLMQLCKTDAVQGYLFGRPEPMEVFEEKFLGI